MYSGTVAAAREASRHGIPSLAVSQAYDEKPIRFREGAKFVRTLVHIMLDSRSNGGVCLNVNVPVRRARGVKITRQGYSAHAAQFSTVERQDRPTRALENTESNGKNEIMLDFHAILNHYISITPLQRDQTDYAIAQELLEAAPRLFPGSRIPGIGLIGFKN
jgi:5'-nucleotidase